MKKTGLSVKIAAMVSTVLLMVMFSAITVFAAPSRGLMQTDAGKNSIEFKWDRLVTADKYEYSYSIDKKIWSSSYTVYHSSASLYSLDEGTTYYVRVRPEDSTVWSEPVAMATSPSLVGKIYQISATTSSATVKWNKVAGATQYRIFTRINLGELVERTLVKTTSVKINGLNRNTRYDLFICAERSAGSFIASGSTGNAKSIYTLAGKVSEITCRSNGFVNNKLEIEWESSNYADGYQIQLINCKTRKAKIYDVKYPGLSYNARENTFYKFRVRAYMYDSYGSEIYDTWTDYKYTQAFHSVKIKQSGNTIKASWAKVSNATSYSVYISKDDSEFKKVATTKKNYYKIKKMGRKKLKKGHKYVIMIVANKKIGNITYHGVANDRSYLYL